MAIPVIAALGAMAIPVIGGAMSLTGGAMSLTGGVLNAASTVGGIAADAAGGVLGAVGGLMGGGKSGNVQSPETEGPTTPMGTYRDRKGVLRNDGTMKQRGSFASDPSKGMSLANVKSSIDPVNAEGEISMLPTGKESQVTLLSQILGQIRTNTGALFSIDAKIGGLIDAFSTPLPPPPPEPQDLIDIAQNKKGENDGDGGGQPGIVSRTFSALGTKLKSLSGSLGTAAKFIGKGLLLGGAFLLFKKYREQIVGVVANIFETLEGWYTDLNSEGDPIKKLLDNVKTFFNESVLPTLKDLTLDFIKMFYNAIRGVANSVLPKQFQLPDIFGEDATIPTKYDTNPDERLSGYVFSEGPDKIGGVRATMNLFDDELYFSGAAADNLGIQQAVKDKLQMMYDYFQGSGGRIQWTGIGEGFELGGGIDSFYKSGGEVDIAGIMTSKPIVDGYDRTLADLDNPNLLTTPFGEGESTFKTAFIDNLVKMSNLKQQSKYEKTGAHITRDFKVFTPFGERAGEVLMDLESETKAILDAAKTYDNQMMFLQGGGSQTNIHAGTEINQSTNVLSTDTNLQYHFGSAITQ